MIKVKMKAWKTLGAAALAFAITVVSARAVLHVYEPFDYAAGDLTGQNGGTGFASAWQAHSSNKGYVWWPNADDTQPGGTYWDGLITNIPTSSAQGEYRFAGGTLGVTAYNRDIYRTLASSAGALAGGDNVLWMSVVLRYASGGSFAIGLGDGYVRDRGRAWQTPTTNFLGWAGYTTVWLNGTRNAVISTNASGGHYVIDTGGTLSSPSKDYIIVFKFTFDPGAGNDTCETYAFDEGMPLSEATFNANKLTATVAGLDENLCNVFSYTHNGQDNIIDEIRIGDSFGDVIAANLVGVTDRAKSSVAAVPASVPADGATMSTVTVTVVDGFSTAITNHSISLLGSTGNATITPASTNTDANGEAVFTVKSSTVETEVFTASNTTDSVTVWQTASVLFLGPTDAGNSSVTGTWDLAVANGVSDSSITITLRDSAGNPVAGNNVTLSGSPGNATITPAGPQVSDANGQVVFQASSSVPGVEVFTATDTSDSVTVTETFSVTFAQADWPALWVYEPFDYAVGALAGQTGGLGFASAWTNNGTAIGWVWDPTNGTVMADTATMNWDGVIDNIPVSTNLGENRFTGGGASVSEAKRDIYRELESSAGAMAGADGVLWMSAVMYRGASSSVGIGLGLGDTILIDRGGYLNFSTPAVGAQTALIGSVRAWYGGGGDIRLNSVVATNTVNTSVDNVGNYAASEGSAFTEDDYVLVFKFRFSGIQDEVQSYAFPESQALSEAAFDANKVTATFTGGFNEDACNLLTWSSARGSTCLDEIRIGNTFEDVIGIEAASRGTVLIIR